MREIDELVYRADPTKDLPIRDGPDRFLLERGSAELEPFFADVALDRYPDELRVTDPDAIPAFVLSGRKLGPETIRRLRSEIAKQIDDSGFVRITKDSGMFIARAP